MSHSLLQKAKRFKGFTLLEVMIAISILIIALAALIGHEGVAIQMSDYSNRVSQATLLAQSKMLDLEHTLLKDSMDALDNCETGDFRDEDMRKFEWEACAYKLEIEPGAIDALTEQVMAMMTGFTGGGIDMQAAANLAAGAAAAQGGDGGPFGQIAMAMGAIPMFLQNLEDKVRKVRLVVKWADAVDNRTVVLERYVTALGVGQQAVVNPAAVAGEEDPNAVGAGGAGAGGGAGGAGGGSKNEGDDPLLGEEGVVK